MHILLGVVDVILALSTLLGRQSFAELALGLILGGLILLRFLSLGDLGRISWLITCGASGLLPGFVRRP